MPIDKIVIIGAGPAGLFCAWFLAEHDLAAKTEIFELGKPIEQRYCNSKSILCTCNPCEVLTGIGGAGGFSDGKITLSSTRGTHLISMERQSFINEVDSTIVRYGYEGKLYTPKKKDVERLREIVESRGLKFDAYPVRHLGSEGMREFIRNFANMIQDKGVKITYGKVTDILPNGTRWRILVKRKNRTYPVDAKYIVVACGLHGSFWFENQARRLGLGVLTGPADIGLRVETDWEKTAQFTEFVYDPKVIYTPKIGSSIRTFCTNPRGYVLTEFHRNLMIRGVNGYAFFNKKTENTNMALLYKIEQGMTYDPKRYVREIARRINLDSNGYPTMQVLRDFWRKRTSSDKDIESLSICPTGVKTHLGNISSALPQHLFRGFSEFLLRLSELFGLDISQTIVYAPEIKYFSYEMDVNMQTMESNLRNLYVPGDVNGKTIGFMMSAIEGILSARSIINKFELGD